ncbi:TVP38/TMEM64 family protein [Slackia heliotrinireducens]|jgi:uncharacterized membrane protein YdjX (TVP38/TMEM64 family)|uniref:TVP38/TMEM64 family protein n=1 Tax=Slackia heliotrinireducens TaxID=84110 RepID=UPI00331535AF
MNKESEHNAAHRIRETIQAKSAEIKEREAEVEEKLDVRVVHQPKSTRLTQADLAKLGLMAVFFLLVLVLFVLMLPWIKELTEVSGREELVSQVRSAGPVGVLMLLGLQLLQIIVAFIPGEAVQMVAGMMYGPLGGTLIILTGCLISSALLFAVVHKLGAPFVRAMIPEKWMGKLEDFENSGNKLDIMVFVLFLIPGMPKDVLTYLVPLTNMKMSRFVGLTTIARIPGVVMSTSAANGLLEGNYMLVAAICGVIAVVAVIGFFNRDRIMAAFQKKQKK